MTCPCCLTSRQLRSMWAGKVSVPRMIRPGNSSAVLFVPGFHVVHAGDVEHAEGLGRPFRHEAGGAEGIHRVPHVRHDGVDARPVAAGLTRLPRRRAQGGQVGQDGEHPVDRVGDVAGAVQEADPLGELASPRSPGRASSGISLPIE